MSLFVGISGWMHGSRLGFDMCTRVYVKRVVALTNEIAFFFFLNRGDVLLAKDDTKDIKQQWGGGDDGIILYLLSKRSTPECWK